MTLHHPTPARRPDRITAEPRGGRGWRTGYWVVIALIVASYVLCATQATADPSPIAFLVQLVTVAVTLWVADVHRAVRRVAWIVLTMAGAASITVDLVGTRGEALDIVLSAASALAFLSAPVAIIAQQVRRRGVDVEALLAAVSAYLMVGMFFTFVYNLIALLTQSPTFGPDVVDSLSKQLFFSFTTLTTVGYGNIVPATPGVQGVAVAEAITGQLFLIIAVARIISGPRPRSLPASRSDEPEVSA
jgi:voltage-gated potassium channel Kch